MVGTNQPDVSFNDQYWQTLEEILGSKLTPDDRDALLMMFREFAASQYAANKAPLLSEVKSQLLSMHEKATELRAEFLFETVSGQMRLSLVNLLIQAYWRHPFDNAAAHFHAEELNEYGSPKKVLSPSRGEIPHRVIHSSSSVDEFFRSISFAVEDAVKEVERRINDPRWFGFDKVEPQKKLIRSVRAWAKYNGIPYSKQADDTLPHLTHLIIKVLKSLPSECQPDRIYSEKTMTRELQRKEPSDK